MQVALKCVEVRSKKVRLWQTNFLFGFDIQNVEVEISRAEGQIWLTLSFSTPATEKPTYHTKMFGFAKLCHETVLFATAWNWKQDIAITCVCLTLPCDPTIVFATATALGIKWHRAIIQHLRSQLPDFQKCSCYHRKMDM